MAFCFYVSLCVYLCFSDQNQAIYAENIFGIFISRMAEWIYWDRFDLKIFQSFHEYFMAFFPSALITKNHFVIIFVTCRFFVSKGFESF